MDIKNKLLVHNKGKIFYDFIRIMNTKIVLKELFTRKKL